MKHVWIIFIFAIAVAADSLTKKKRDAQEDRNFDLQAVGNGQLRAKTHHLQKRLDSASVTAAATVIASLQTVLNKIGEYSPKIAMAIVNDGPHTLEGLNIYFESGTSDLVVPAYVPKGEGFNLPARSSGVARGAVGVIALYSPKDDKTIYVLYSVPNDTNLYSNWWNVEVRDGKKDADGDIYSSLCSKAIPGDGKRRRLNVGKGYSCNGVMSDSSKGTLEVRIEKKLIGDIAVVINSMPDILESIGDYNTKISMAIINDGPHEWKTLKTYFKHGTSDVKLPDSVHGGQRFNYAARKKSYALRGVRGIIGLYIPKDDVTIHILFSVPYSTDFYSNWWKVQMIDDKKKPGDGCFYQMYSVATKATGKRDDGDLDKGYSYSVVMSTSDKATLNVRIKKNYNEHGFP